MWVPISVNIYYVFLFSTEFPCYIYNITSFVLWRPGLTYYIMCFTLPNMWYAMPTITLFSSWLSHLITTQLQLNMNIGCYVQQDKVAIGCHFVWILSSLSCSFHCQCPACHLHPSYSKCGPSVGIASELVKNAASQALPQTYWIPVCILGGSSGDA